MQRAGSTYFNFDLGGIMQQPYFTKRFFIRGSHALSGVRSLEHGKNQARSENHFRVAGSQKKCRGQGMTEYIVILALVVISAIGVYSLLGKTVRNQVAGVAQEISGQSAKSELQQAKSSANSASSKANKNYGLGNYDENNP